MVKKDDLKMDAIVETIRNTLDQRTLRDCLRLLTAAVTVSPVCFLNFECFLTLLFFSLRFVLFCYNHCKIACDSLR